jgi:hypothetical protein
MATTTSSPTPPASEPTTAGSDASGGAGSTIATARAGGTSDPGVERTRAITGLAAVVAGDVAIALAAILGIVFATRGSIASSALPQVVAILSSGFTAIGTMTTAYFGIKSMSNTANNLAGPPTGSGSGTSGHQV